MIDPFRAPSGPYGAGQPWPRVRHRARRRRSGPSAPGTVVVRRPGGRAPRASRVSHPDGLRSAAYSDLAADRRSRVGASRRRGRRWARRGERLHLGVRARRAATSTRPAVRRRRAASSGARCRVADGRLAADAAVGGRRGAIRLALVASARSGRPPRSWRDPLSIIRPGPPSVAARRRVARVSIEPKGRSIAVTAVVTMKQLLEAGVHFGHQTRRWNPKMKRFIHGERNGIYIIDLHQTLDRHREVLHVRPRPRRRRRHDPLRRHQEAGPGLRSRATPRSAACRTSTSAGWAACSPTSRPSRSASAR